MWDSIVNLLAHGGFKLLIVAVAFGGHLLKKNAEKAAKERPPTRDLPDAMPAPLRTQTPRPSSSGNSGGAPTQDLGSPWADAGDPFNGKS